MTDGTRQTVDPLRLGVCPGCGYALQGLPDAGVCPECGRPYDQQTTVLYGWAKGQRATVANASPGMLVWLVTVQLFFPFMLLATGSLGRMPGGAYVWITVPLASTGYLLWKRWNSPLPTPIQVHLSSEGCLQLDEFSKGNPTPAPWGDVDSVALNPVAEGKHRLTLTRAVAWWWPVPTPRVDALVKCDREQAEVLRERIAVWQGRAAAAKKTGGFPVIPKSQIPNAESARTNSRVEL